MKIWYLTSEYPPLFGGGISMYIDIVSKMMSENSNDVKIIVRDTEESRVESIANNCEVIRFKHMQGEYYSYLGYWTALAFQYMEETYKQISIYGAPDIIEVQDYNAIGYYLLQKKHQGCEVLKNVKIVVHLHTPTFELAKINETPRFKFPTYWIGQMEKFCITAADAVVTQSKFLKNQLKEYRAVDDIQVISLPYKKNDPFATEYKPSLDYLFMGRCEYRKGIIQTLDAFSNFWDDGNRSTLTVLGGDTFFHPRKEMMKSFLFKKYDKYVKAGLLVFKEPVNPAELGQEISSYKCVIIPSLYENFPYNCIIPMSLATPVLVSSSGGQAEMVNETGKNGFIFDWNKANDFEHSLSTIDKLPLNELKQIGLNGQSRIFKMTNLKENYNCRIRFYEEVMALENDESKYPNYQNLIREKDKVEINYEKDLLSIVIPYYNLSDFVLETLESALNSNYQNKEIIIVNDGSDDVESISILNDIKNKNYSNVKIITIKNGGLANARNVGANSANGEFVAFLDADDLIDPEFYSKSIKILNKCENVDFVYSWVEYFDSGSGVWPTFDAEFPYILGMNMLTAFVVVRTQSYLNFGVNKESMKYGMEDYEGWVNMLENGCLGVSIPEILVKYRIRFNSMSRNFNREMVIFLLDRLSSHHPKLYQKYGLEIYNLIIANGPGYLWNNPTYEYPIIGFEVQQNDAIKESENIDIKNDTFAMNQELKRIANSKYGKKILSLFFKLKINKLFN